MCLYITGSVLSAGVVKAMQGARGAPYGSTNIFCDTLRWERGFMQRWG
jgi:hypothetical protein